MNVAWSPHKDRRTSVCACVCVSSVSAQPSSFTRSPAVYRVSRNRLLKGREREALPESPIHTAPGAPLRSGRYPNVSWPSGGPRACIFLFVSGAGCVQSRLGSVSVKHDPPCYLRWSHPLCPLRERELLMTHSTETHIFHVQVFPLSLWAIIHNEK